MTLSQAKNAMRRAVEDLIDPPLKKSEENMLWEYFQSCCAYCGKKIDRSTRHGHLDHLVSGSNGGTNSIGNRVLACNRCNGDEKRERDWKEFLKEKCNDEGTFRERQRRIGNWTKQMPRRMKKMLSTEAELAKKSVEESIAEFAKRFAVLRSLIR